jgi:hypothetical protein
MDRTDHSVDFFPARQLSARKRPDWNLYLVKVDAWALEQTPLNKRCGQVRTSPVTLRSGQYEHLWSNHTYS